MGGRRVGAHSLEKSCRARLKATRWKPTTNLPGNRSPLRWRARISLPSKPRNRKRTHRKRSISTRSIRKLTDVRKEQGLASDFDVSQIKSRTAAAEDALYAAQAARAQTIRAIEVVTSRYPAGRLDVRRSFPGQPRAVPAGLPAQILERRPDLIASERRFAAAFHRVNEARTARLPRFVLSATSGLGTAAPRRGRRARCPRLESRRWDHAADFLWR